MIEYLDLWYGKLIERHVTVIMALGGRESGIFITLLLNKKPSLVREFVKVYSILSD